MKTCKKGHQYVPGAGCPECRTIRRKAYSAKYYLNNREFYLEKAREDRKQFPEKHQQRHRKKNYGITEIDYLQLLANQTGQCAICQIDLKMLESKKVHIDHDHETGKVRGILCNHCNVMIGMAKEDLSILEKAIKYLDKIVN